MIAFLLLLGTSVASSLLHLIHISCCFPSSIDFLTSFNNGEFLTSSILCVSALIIVPSLSRTMPRVFLQLLACIQALYSPELCTLICPHGTGHQELLTSLMCLW